MERVSLDIPEGVLLATGLSREALAAEARRLLAFKLFERGQLSAGKAAELCGLDKVAFLDAASAEGIPVIAMDEDDLDREFAAADRLARGHQ